MTQNTELMPCPFCGGAAELASSSGWHGAGCERMTAPGVMCPGARFGLQYRTAAAAADAWNRRAPAAQVPQGWSLREAAQDALAWLDEDDLNMTHNIRERLRSALAAAPQPPEARKPLTDEQISELAEIAFKEHFEDKNDDFHVALGRAIERAHGITGEPT